MIDVDISDRHADLLEAIKGTCGLTTDEEVVEQALIVLGFAAHETAQGRAFGSVDEANLAVRVVETPALAGARRHRAPAG